MTINEKEIHITKDGFGRAAIVQRSDGFFCIYMHWIWPGLSTRSSWVGDAAPIATLYQDKEPLCGVYGIIEDARKEVFALPGFTDDLTDEIF